MSDTDSWKTERYPPLEEGGVQLAQELRDTGLLAQVNAILHPHGLAMGVMVGSDDRVTGLSLHESADPSGIWFDEATTELARGKMRRAGILRRHRVLAVGVRHRREHERAHVGRPSGD